MDVPQLFRLRKLEAENAKLKKMYAELVMGNEALHEVIAKKLRTYQIRQRYIVMWWTCSLDKCK